jgi:hypothetical protein
MDIVTSNFLGDGDVGNDIGNNMDELCAVTQSFINNIVALLYHLCFLQHKHHQFGHQQVEGIPFPPEHRPSPRQAKAGF